MGRCYAHSCGFSDTRLCIDRRGIDRAVRCFKLKRKHTRIFARVLNVEVPSNSSHLRIKFNGCPDCEKNNSDSREGPCVPELNKINSVENPPPSTICGNSHSLWPSPAASLTGGSVVSKKSRRSLYLPRKPIIDTGDCRAWTSTGLRLSRRSKKAQQSSDK